MLLGTLHMIYSFNLSSPINSIRYTLLFPFAKAERLSKLSQIIQSICGRSNQNLSPGLFGCKELAFYLVMYKEKQNSRSNSEIRQI